MVPGSGAAALPSSLSVRQSLRPSPAHLNQNLHFNKIPGWFAFTTKPELSRSRAVILGCQCPGAPYISQIAKQIQDIVANTWNILCNKISGQSQGLVEMQGKESRCLLVNFKTFRISFPFYSTPSIVLIMENSHSKCNWEQIKLKKKGFRSSNGFWVALVPVKDPLKRERITKTVFI